MTPGHYLQRLDGGPRDYDRLLEEIGDARFVLLGEASHGTQEFYFERALAGFRRFPAWMWRNEVVHDFVAWLREHNRKARLKAGFYGLDLYSMYTSMEAVLRYLERIDPQAARRARERYACLDRFGEDSQAYGYAASLGVDSACEDEVVRQLLDLRRRAAAYSTRDGHVATEAFFEAEQNARLVKNAEAYYRTMFRGGVSSWASAPTPAR